MKISKIFQVALLINGITSGMASIHEDFIRMCPLQIKKVATRMKYDLQKSEEARTALENQVIKLKTQIELLTRGDKLSKDCISSGTSSRTSLETRPESDDEEDFCLLDSKGEEILRTNSTEKDIEVTA